MSPSPQPTSTNLLHLKNQFAHRFIRALNTLNHTKTTPHDHNNHMCRRRSTRVKIASYAAMASVVGSRRAWSRAVLSKIRNRSRNQSRNRGLLLRNRKRVDHRILTNCYYYQAKVLLKRRNPNVKRDYFDPFGNSGQESKLRKLVPGGETMDSWCLMGETADYIKCLAAQSRLLLLLPCFRVGKRYLYLRR